MHRVTVQENVMKQTKSLNKVFNIDRRLRDGGGDRTTHQVKTCSKNTSIWWAKNNKLSERKSDNIWRF